MSEKVEILKEFAEYAFNRFERTIEGLAEQELDWKPMEESNNMRWILNHLSRIVNVYAMMYIRGEGENRTTCPRAGLRIMLKRATSLTSY
jgi:hypothetical protein